MRACSASMTGGGDAKSMSATQSGKTSGPYLCHLFESVPRRSTIRSKSNVIESPRPRGRIALEDGAGQREFVYAFAHGHRTDRRLPHDVSHELSSDAVWNARRGRRRARDPRE